MNNPLTGNLVERILPFGLYQINSGIDRRVKDQKRERKIIKARYNQEMKGGSSSGITAMQRMGCCLELSGLGKKEDAANADCVNDVIFIEAEFEFHSLWSAIVSIEKEFVEVICVNKVKRKTCDAGIKNTNMKNITLKGLA